MWLFEVKSQVPIDKITSRGGSQGLLFFADEQEFPFTIALLSK
jgi:hypothetical protein